jgi:hypothetical protein
VKPLRKIFVTFIMAVLLIVSINTTISAAKTDTEQAAEELYKNLFITLIYPHVEKAIGDYYDEYMNYLPGEAPYFYKFLSIDKNRPFKNYSYTIVLQVAPYVGPHLSVGVDRTTMKIELSGVTIEKYEHLESHRLPPHYQNILKKPLPEPVV